MPMRKRERARKGRWRTENNCKLFSDYFYIILNIMYKYVQKLKILKFCKIFLLKYTIFRISEGVLNSMNTFIVSLIISGC
jgi:hypothetical protein